MLIDLNNLTKEQNIIFDKIFNETKSKYINLIDELYLKSDKSIYFLFSSITSRDLYLNDTLIKIVQISFIRHCLQKKNVKKIVLYDKNQKEIVSKLIQDLNCNTKLFHSSKNNRSLVNILRILYWL